MTRREFHTHEAGRATRWSIRDEAHDDHERIDAIHRAAFERDARSRHDEHAIVRALREDGELVVSLVAESDGTVIAHVAISPVSISDGTTGWHGLGPVAVDPAFQKRDIGRRLVARALERLRVLGGAGCVVLGDPPFYAAFGFRPDAALVLRGVPAAYFQAVRFSGRAPRGTVCYHASFGTDG